MNISLLLDHKFIYLNFIFLALLSLALIWPGCGEWRLDLTVCVWTCWYLFVMINLNENNLNFFFV